MDQGHQEFARERRASFTKNFSSGSTLQARAYGKRGSHKAWLIDSDGVDGAPKQLSPGGSTEARRTKLLQ